MKIVRVMDGMFLAYEVRGPRGGFLGFFYTRKAAEKWVKDSR